MLQPDRIELKEMRIGGRNGRYQMGDTSGIGAQWQAYNDAGTTAGDVVPQAWYGVCHEFDGQGGFGYLCGMELRGSPAPGTDIVTLPAGGYARFRVTGGLDLMPQVWAEIYSHWLHQPQWKPRPGPSVEFYPPEFDAQTGAGGYEIWVPVV